GAVVMLFAKTKASASAAPAPTIAKPTGPVPATAATPRTIFLQPFTVEGTDPTLADRANVVRLASIETMRAYPEVRVADNATADATAFTATVRGGATGPEIVTGSTAVPMLDAASGIQSVVQWIATRSE